MTKNELLRALRAMAAQTGFLPCDGCGREHSCGTRGCAILRGVIRALRCATIWHEMREGGDAPKPGRAALMQVEFTDEDGTFVETLYAAGMAQYREAGMEAPRVLRYTSLPGELGERLFAPGWMRGDLMAGLKRLRWVRAGALCMGCAHEDACHGQGAACAIIAAAEEELRRAIIWHDGEQDRPKRDGAYLAQMAALPGNLRDGFEIEEENVFLWRTWRDGAWLGGNDVLAWVELPEED